MVGNKNFLCALLMLTGCNHLVENGMVPGSSRALPTNHDPQATGAPYLTAFDCLLDDLAHALNVPGNCYPVDGFSPTNPIRPNGTVRELVHSAEDTADQAILSMNSLVNALISVFTANIGHRPYLAPDILDIFNRLGITLNLQFVGFCAALSPGSNTHKAHVKLATAYAACALHIAYLVAHNTPIACDAPITCSAVYPTVSIPTNVVKAAAKAGRAVAILALTAHFTVALAANSCAAFHAACAADPANAVAEARKATENATKATKAAIAAHNAAELAVRYDQAVKAVNGDAAVIFARGVVLAVNSAAARAHTAAAHAHAAATHASVSAEAAAAHAHAAATHASVSAEAAAAHAHAAATHAHAATSAISFVHANATSTDAFRNAVSDPRNKTALDFNLAKAALDIL